MQSTAKYDASPHIELKLQLPRRPATNQQHQSAIIKPGFGLLDEESPRARQVAGPISETTAEAVPSHDTTKQDSPGEPKEPAGLPKPSVSLPANDTRGTRTGGTSLPEQEFACPYLKKNPAIWGQRPSCRGPSFDSIHRLKEHLYRVHQQKPNCPRCRSILPTQDDVNIHLKSKTPCDVLQDIVVEGFDVAQREKLRSKRLSRGKSGQEKWEDIFRILFPDCNEIPDPDYNHNFDGVAPDPTTAGKKRLLDIESMFTDGLPQELEEEVFKQLEGVIGSQLDRQKRKKVMQVVETLVIKVLQQPLVG
ncbi:hypothetical protein K456DRAFT_482273 [Colletotrichum gloeosporioides 23]|nr:hypothetical protein K456DRAFT_482273 [Colletotrichum gloeosporioides 23]